MSDTRTRNEDWLRTRSWDLTNPDGSLVQTAAEYVRLRGRGDPLGSLRRLVNLPVWEAAPANLRAEVESILGATGLEAKHGDPKRDPVAYELLHPGAARRALLGHPVNRTLGSAFSKAGHSLFLVGGSVRDAQGGHRDFADLDYTTDARPDQIRRVVDGLGPLWTIGEEFGTIGVSIDGHKTEITTFRSESYDEASRKPVVGFGNSIHDDLVRRDLTINAMALTIAGDGHYGPGDLVDPHGGAEDFAANRLRTPGDPMVTMSEDPLRQLRAIRFAAKRDAKLDAPLADAIVALRDRLAIVAPERRGAELRKILDGGPATTARAIGLARDLGVAPYLFGGFSVDADAEAAVRRLPAGADQGTILAAMAGPEALGSMVAMTLTNEEQADVSGAVRLSAALAAHPTTPELRRLLRANDPAAIGRVQALGLPANLAAEVSALTADPALRAPLPVTGRDLIAAGMKPGPAMGEALARVELAFLANPALTRAEALVVAMGLEAKHGDPHRPGYRLLHPGAGLPRVIAIDGPAGSGKSSVAKRVAEVLGYRHLDTGALYRGVGLASLADPEAGLAQLAASIPYEPDNPALRTPEVTAAAAAIASHPDVRAIIGRRAHEMAVDGLVVEGRDTGDVFPDAAKVFMTADLEARARRRAEGRPVDVVAAELAGRDALDSTRQAGPLRQHAEAVVIDTTHNTVDASADALITALTPGERQARPLKVRSVDAAVAALAEGRWIELAQPRQVSTLLDRLAAIAADAEAKGERAPVYDLCKVAVRGTNLFCADSLGRPRISMPQLKTRTPEPGSLADALPRNDRGQVDIAPAFRDHLAARGVAMTSGREKARYLRASQGELNGVQVAVLAKRLRADPARYAADEPLLVSRDNYIIDGHHRWAAHVGIELGDRTDMDMRITRVDLGIVELLAAATRFATAWGTTAQSHGEEAKHGDPNRPGYELLHPGYRIRHPELLTAITPTGREARGTIADWDYGHGRVRFTDDGGLTWELPESALRHDGRPIDAPGINDLRAAHEARLSADALSNLDRPAPPLRPVDETNLWAGSTPPDVSIFRVAPMRWYITNNRTNADAWVDDPTQVGTAARSLDPNFVHGPNSDTVINGVRWPPQSGDRFEVDITWRGSEEVTVVGQLDAQGPGLVEVSYNGSSYFVRKTDVLGPAVRPRRIDRQVLVNGVPWPPALDSTFRAHTRAHAMDAEDYVFDATVTDVWNPGSPTTMVTVTDTEGLPFRLGRQNVVGPVAGDPPLTMAEHLTGLVEQPTALISPRAVGDNYPLEPVATSIDFYRANLDVSGDRPSSVVERARIMDGTEKAAAAMFDIDYTAPDGTVMVARVTDATVTYHAVPLVDVVGGVYVQRSDGSWENVGEFHRRVSMGKQIVYHELLRITEEEYQGKGFGEAFIEHAEAEYRVAGLEKVYVSAGLDGGGYAWARMGFDWDPEDPVNEDVVRRLSAFADGDTWGRPSGLSAISPKAIEEAQAEATDMLGQFRRSGMAENWPTPNEIAMLGWKDRVGEGPAAVWPGKAILRGAHWNGVLDLAKLPALAKALTAQDRDTIRRLRREELAEWLATYGSLGDEAVDWNPPAVTDGQSHLP